MKSEFTVKHGVGVQEVSWREISYECPESGYRVLICENPSMPDTLWTPVLYNAKGSRVDDYLNVSLVTARRWAVRRLREARDNHRARQAAIR